MARYFAAKVNAKVLVVETHFSQRYKVGENVATKTGDCGSIENSSGQQKKLSNQTV